MSAPRPHGLYAAEVPDDAESRRWRALGRAALLIFNVVALLACAVVGVDWLVRYRVEQFVNAYHQGVIVPLTKPSPPAPQGPPANPRDK